MGEETSMSDNMWHYTMYSEMEGVHRINFEDVLIQRQILQGQNLLCGLAIDDFQKLKKQLELEGIQYREVVELTRSDEIVVLVNPI